MTSHSIDGGPQNGSGYRSRTSRSPTALGGVVLVHLALGAAIVSMTAIDIVHLDPTVMWAYNVPKPPDAKPVPPKPQPEARTRVTTAPRTEVNLPVRQTSDVFPVLPPVIPEVTGGGRGLVPAPVPLPDPVPPVLAQARPDARFARDFQPPYPAAMLRLQQEGDVTVRVQIGADGRVLDVALVSTADPAFFDAAKRQALARWRFLPATRDGVPVASERVMTIHFRLTD